MTMASYQWHSLVLKKLLLQLTEGTVKVLINLTERNLKDQIVSIEASQVALRLLKEQVKKL